MWVGDVDRLWSLDGESGVFSFRDFEDSFTVDGDRIVFAHAGSPDEFVCTRQG